MKNLETKQSSTNAILSHADKRNGQVKNEIRASDTERREPTSEMLALDALCDIDSQDNSATNRWVRYFVLRARV